MKKIILTLALVSVTAVTAFSQIGIRAGVNLASEIRKFNSTSELTKAFGTENLTGFQAGLVYQLNPEIGHSGFGFETGVLFTQKGSMFKIDKATGLLDNLIKGYHEVNYLEVPLNLRYKLNIAQPLSIYGSAGVYGGCAVTSKTVFSTPIETIKKSDSFDDFMSRIDYGVNLGVGVTVLNKIQIGANWSEGLQKKDASKSILDRVDTENGKKGTNLELKKNNRTFSVSLTYLF